MTRYAEKTVVPADRTRIEIENTLRRYGARSFAYAWEEEPDRALIGFELTGRRIRIFLPLPDRSAREFRLTSQGRARVSTAAEAAYEQAIRQRWRALLLVIKAKLEAVTAGITTVEQEFLPFVVLPDGETVGEWFAPKLEQALATGRMPPMLPGLAGPDGEPKTEWVE